MVLMIDNYDSFTYNIVQYCLELGADIKVVRNDEISIADIQKLNCEKIIISPGPCSPNEAGISLDIVKNFKNTLPIFGICLGHQSIAQYFGAKIIEAKNMMHGKTSVINQDANNKSILFKNITSSFVATRYHSLVVEDKNLPSDIVVTARSDDDNEIMALEIKNTQIYGVQFHPESILSEYGKVIIQNFLDI
ncbi:Anthranilate synthase, amidotransferase component @ Para-aminobenzoate synthase, amidotransferase component [hydrothermal vent metagenome]|uniref:Anthranilate synthase, amidotransferase component @ Para-aminobenzoate synthase, amidotransferase component n=1 Tax=hydrothermal vent metagenome TaxID=652676 RepID=A0A3B1DTZ7_9ZZZZ